MDYRRNIFVTVGTDYHPFDRLIEWTDDWAEHAAARGRVLVQYGRSKRPRTAESVEYMDYVAMEDAMRGADAVVSHGGPGTIMLALTHGKRPIVVPRLSSLGEHVDDHQLAFASRIEADGTIELAQSREQLFDLVEAGLAAPDRVVAMRQPDIDKTVDRFEELVDALVAARAPTSALAPRPRRGA
jgi:UDP-N-acetylglucosamine transferase subunit ALG13